MLPRQEQQAVSYHEMWTKSFLTSQSLCQSSAENQLTVLSKWFTPMLHHAALHYATRLSLEMECKLTHVAERLTLTPLLTVALNPSLAPNPSPEP